MDEPKAVESVKPDEPKEWVTPELVVEDVKDVTFGGTGLQPVFGGENKVTTFYHS